MSDPVTIGGETCYPSGGGSGGYECIYQGGVHHVPPPMVTNTACEYGYWEAGADGLVHCRTLPDAQWYGVPHQPTGSTTLSTKAPELLYHDGPATNPPPEPLPVVCVQGQICPAVTISGITWTNASVIMNQLPHQQETHMYDFLNFVIWLVGACTLVVLAGAGIHGSWEGFWTRVRNVATSRAKQAVEEHERTLHRPVSTEPADDQ